MGDDRHCAVRRMEFGGNLDAMVGKNECVSKE